MTGKIYIRKILFTVLTLTIFSCTNSNNTMGLFGKLFGKKENQNQTVGKYPDFDTTLLIKTAEMLNEDKYWNIIEKSLKKTTNQEDQEKFLISEIEKLSPSEMVGFRLMTDKLLYDTYNSAMWCAGYIMNGGCSDDGFEYFRNWVISRGKETYYKTKENPDYLINEVDNTMEFYDFESFWYVANEAFKNKTGKDLYDYIDYENYKTSEGDYPQFEFTWQEEKPESMKKICPKLFDKLFMK